MMANFTAGDWGKLFELFPGRVLRGERGTNKVITKGWNRFDAGNTVTEGELEEIDEDNPQINLGIRTGRGLVVVDIDDTSKEGLIRSIVGDSNFEVSTPRGKHLYFRTDPEARLASRINQGIDIFHSPQGDSERGSYVVAPGSVRTADKDQKLVSYGVERAAYDLEVCDGVDEFGDIAYRSPKVLEKLYQAVSGKVNPERKDYQDIVFDLSTVRLPHDGSPALPGSRNNSAASLVGTWISEGFNVQQCVARLDEWNQSNPQPLDDGELHHVVNSIFKSHVRNNPSVEPIRVSLEPIKLYKPEQAAKPLDDLDLRPPGALGEFFDWHMSTARFPNAKLAAQSALAFGSVVLGRNHVTSGDNWSSLYFLSIGKSTTGKEHGKRTIEAALDDADLDELIGGRGYTSPGAVLSALRDKPTHIAVIDEFGDYLEACNSKGNSQRKEAMSMLNEAFSASGSVLRQAFYSSMGLTKKQRDEQDQANIEHPAVTMFLLTQPQRFYDSLGESDIANGFLGRLLVMDMDAERRPPVYTGRLTKPPAKLSSWAREARNAGRSALSEALDTAYDMKPKPKQVDITEGADRLFQEFFVEQMKEQNRLDAHGLGNVIGRMNEVAQKLALIVAVSINAETPVITESIAEWCANYCRFAFLSMADAARKNVGGSEFGKVRQKVLTEIIEAGERGMTQREMGRKFKGMKPKELAETIKALDASGEIALLNITTKGRPRQAFVAIDAGAL